MTKVPLSITFSACTDSMNLSWVGWTLKFALSYYNGFIQSKDEYTRYCWQ